MCFVFEIPTFFKSIFPKSDSNIYADGVDYLYLSIWLFYSASYVHMEIKYFEIQI